MDPAAFRNSVAGLRAATASYGDIVEWLADCKASVKAPRVAAFIDDLTGHIRGMILGEKRMQDDDALIALILADERKLEAFFKTQALGGSVRSELLCRFIEDIGRISGGRRSFSSGYWDSNRYRIRLDLGDGILAVLGTDYPNFAGSGTASRQVSRTRTSKPSRQGRQRSLAFDRMAFCRQEVSRAARPSGSGDTNAPARVPWASAKPGHKILHLGWPSITAICQSVRELGARGQAADGFWLNLTPISYASNMEQNELADLTSKKRAFISRRLGTTASK